MAQLRAADAAQRDAAWLERQLVSALQGWQDTEDDLRAILRAERLRRDRRPELMGTVTALNREFDARLQ